MTPLSAEETKEAMEDTSINPKEDVIGKVVNITLIFDGVEFDPAALYDALDDKYTSVTSVKDTVDRGNYLFKIGA